MRLSHWRKMQINFLRTGKKTERHITDIKSDIHVHSAVLSYRSTQPTLSPFGQLAGEQHVGQLALSVGPDRVVGSVSAQVIKLDLAHVVS